MLLDWDLVDHSYPAARSPGLVAAGAAADGVESDPHALAIGRGVRSHTGGHGGSCSHRCSQRGAV